MEINLVERSARMNIGGTIRIVSAFSRNFQAIGWLFDQQIWETRTSDSSTEGMETPAAVRVEESCMAHMRGSVPLSSAALVSSSTPSQSLCFAVSSSSTGDAIWSLIGELWCRNLGHGIWGRRNSTPATPSPYVQIFGEEKKTRSDGGRRFKVVNLFYFILFCFRRK